MLRITSVRYDGCETITDTPLPRFEVRAEVTPRAVDALMAYMTGMNYVDAGPYRDGLIRMRSWDLGLHDILPYEDGERLVIEVGPDVGMELGTDPEEEIPEYTVLFVPPELWRWQSRSGSSFMRLRRYPNGSFHLNGVLTFDGILALREAVSFLPSAGIIISGVELLDEAIREFREKDEEWRHPDWPPRSCDTTKV